MLALNSLQALLLRLQLRGCSESSLSQQNPSQDIPLPLRKSVFVVEFAWGLRVPKSEKGCVSVRDKTLLCWQRSFGWSCLSS